MNWSPYSCRVKGCPYVVSEAGMLCEAHARDEVSCGDGATEWPTYHADRMIRDERGKDVPRGQLAMRYLAESRPQLSPATLNSWEMPLTLEELELEKERRELEEEESK